MFVLACALYFVYELTKIDREQITSLSADDVILTLGLSVIFYTVLLACVTLGFAQLLISSVTGPILFKQAVTVWGKANLAKYLPGNFFHFAGRQLLGARYSWPQAGIALASALEIVLQLLIPFFFIALALATSGRFNIILDFFWLAPIVVVALVAILLLLFYTSIAKFFLFQFSNIFGGRKVDFVLRANVFSAAAYYAIFFIGSCVICTAFYSVVQNPVDGAGLLTLNAVFLISWVIGFVVPGAPGGIGVREGTFAMLGGSFFPTESLLLVALLMRVTTLAGEGLLFLIAVCFEVSNAKTPAFAASAEPKGELHTSAGRRLRHADRHGIRPLFRG
jgi:uncharacterized membrane protein YbhN (UPF0104 family)